MAIMTQKAESGAKVRPAAVRRQDRWSSKWVVIALRLLVILLVLVLWQLASGRMVPDYAISRPTEVVTALRQYLGSSAGWLDIQTTAIEIGAGFAIGVAVGTVMGLVLGSFRLAGQVLEPLIAAVNGIPKIALAPLFLLFFGIGSWSKIAIAVTGVSFVVFYNLYLACGCASASSWRSSR